MENWRPNRCLATERVWISGFRSGFMGNDVSIVIADDHPIFRAGLRALIQSERGFELASEAVDGEEAIAVTKKLKPDILLLDLAMPKVSGLEVLKQLSAMSL